MQRLRDRMKEEIEEGTALSNSESLTVERAKGGCACLCQCLQVLSSPARRGEGRDCATADVERRSRWGIMIDWNSGGRRRMRRNGVDSVRRIVR